MPHRLTTTSLLLLRVASVATLGLALAGCAAGGGWAAAAVIAVSLGALSLSGCASSHDPRRDSSSEEPDGGSPFDGGTSMDAGGVWESCCNDGRIESCFCPSGWACNYGWFNYCDDGTCTIGSECPGVDAGVPDAGGTWEPCCNDGRIESCFCPSDVECNYGWFNDCGDGYCAYTVDDCAPPPPG